MSTSLFIAAVVLITFRMFAWRHADRGASVLIFAGLLVSSQLALEQFMQQGSKLFGTGAVGLASQGWSVAPSGDGNTTTVSGYGDNSNAGAAWVFTHSGSVWTQQGNKLVGTSGVAAAFQDSSVTQYTDANTAMVRGYGDNSNARAAYFQPTLSSSQATHTIQAPQTWIPAVNLGGLQVTPSNNLIASESQGDAFSPSQFNYMLTAPDGDQQRAELAVSLVDVSGSEETNEEGPNITVTSPEDGAHYVHQPINIIAIAWGKAASIVLYGDENELRTCIETTSCSTVWQSKRLPRGGHTASATVTDMTGRQESDAITIYVTSWKREEVRDQVFEQSGRVSEHASRGTRTTEAR
jgi:hypothetical protein